MRKKAGMRKKRRVFYIVLLVLFCHGRISFASAAENVEITASAASAEAGDIVDISFMMENNPGTTMYELYIEYDTETLEVISADDGGGYPEWFAPDVAVLPLYISAGDALSMKNITECQTLSVVHFKVKEEAAEGEYRFWVKGLFLNADLDEFEVVYKDTGYITVESIGNAGVVEKNTENHPGSGNKSESGSEEINSSSGIKNTDSIENTNTLNSKEVENSENNLEESQNPQDSQGDASDKNNNKGKEMDKMSVNSADAGEKHEKEDAQKEQIFYIFLVVIGILIVSAGIVGGVVYYKKKK